MNIDSAQAMTIVNTIRVRSLPLLADIGINPDEIGRRQPLVISVELKIVGQAITAIDQTIDYRRIAALAEDLARVHIPLIETFGQTLARRCLDLGGVICAKVEIEKPFALTRGQAGVEIVMRRA